MSETRKKKYCWKFKKKVLSAGIEEKYCRFTKKNIAVDENKIFGNEQKYCWFMKKIIAVDEKNIFENEQKYFRKQYKYCRKR
jgi:hypothetical protein